MKIVKLEAENFKRLTAVSINPDGTMCQITGRNGQGKSSVLDAIQAAFGGAKLSPDQPIRKGATGARVVVETDEIKVTRKWTPKGDTLVVESKDGARYPSPQAMLDKLTGNLSFDPLAFSRMPPKQQAAILREVTGLDTSALDGERAKVFERRTAINAEVKQLEAQLAAAVVPEAPAEIPDEIDVAEVAERKAEAERQRSENRRLRGNRDEAKTDLDEQLARVESLRAQLIAAEDLAERLTDNHRDAILACADLVEPDTAAIDKQIAYAKEHNLRVRQLERQLQDSESAKLRRDTINISLEERQDGAKRLTNRIAEIDLVKAAMLADASFPVPGMSVEGDQVLVDGVPFSQASTSEQIRVGLAMSAALNPHLRVVLVRDGSLLDDESMRIVAEWAESHDMQVFLERVANGEPVGIVIEDGHLADESITQGA